MDNASIVEKSGQLKMANNKELYKIFFKYSVDNETVEYEDSPRSGFWRTIKTVKKRLESLEKIGRICRVETYILEPVKNQTIEEFLNEHKKK